MYYESAVTIKERHGANADSCTVRDLTFEGVLWQPKYVDGD